MLQRASTAFLVGILFSTCATYLFALAFARIGHPLLYANILYFAIAAVAIYFFWPFRGEQQLFAYSEIRDPDGLAEPRPPGDWRIDLLCLTLCIAVGCWLMFATLNYKDGVFQFAIKSWSDFGANLSLTQSLALGSNYPTVHPFYPSEIVRYHFLFWFLAANFSYLGMNVVLSINLLSVISLISLLILILTFAETLFKSRAVARIAVILFFLASSSLSYIPFLYARNGFADAIGAVLGLKDFLKSGFPYRGDDWGALSVSVFSNQRQLLSAVAIIIVVLIHLIQLYRKSGAISQQPEQMLTPRSDGTHESELRPECSATKISRRSIWAMIFCGVLIGSLPYWNSAVFVAGCIILGSLFILFPLRRYTAILIGTVIIIGLPQILMLRAGGAASAAQSLFHWGYIIAEPTLYKLVEYLGWTFGFRWVLIFAALYFVSGSYRRLFLALSAPAVVVFVLQLSTDVFNNHKLLNIWTVLSGSYVAYALWRIARYKIFGKVLAVALAIVMSLGAVIDLMPLHNDGFVSVPHENDRLTAWLLQNTSGSDLFLTDTILSHPILFSGRKVFLGNTLFAWTAGYDLAERERTHRRMLTVQDIVDLKTMLSDNDIDYIAIDDALRSNALIKGLNEQLIAANFELVFNDIERRHGNLKIYRVKS